MKAKHKYMFGFSATVDGGKHYVVGHITYTSKQLLELGINEVGEHEMGMLGKVLEKRYEYTNVMVLGVTKLPMKVKL